MHARLVIPEQPIEDFVLGLTNGFKAFSVRPVITFRDANSASLGALSQQLPLRLIEAVMPHC